MNGILVVNAGSTSLKLSLVEGDSSSAVASLAEVPDDVRAVAHRVVHGGSQFRDPVLIDETVEAALRALSELAPLHSRPALDALDAARRVLPGVPHVAVFDTAFHATISEEATHYAVPRRWREAWGIRRYGFHGLSVEWAAGQVKVARLVVCHLGGGCSVTAVGDGHSIDTTMGFSPLGGIPMATRSGSLDPEVLLYLLRTGHLDPTGLEHALELESGLLGLSGVSARVEELERSREPQAQLALRVFGRCIATAVAAQAVSLGGVDALVFTGGVGENSASVRAGVCTKLALLGVEIDPSRNIHATPDAELAADGSLVRIVALRSREDLVAARAAQTVLD